MSKTKKIVIAVVSVVAVAAIGVGIWFLTKGTAPVDVIPEATTTIETVVETVAPTI